MGAWKRGGRLLIENRSRQVRLGQFVLSALVSLTLAACGGGGSTKPDASSATDSGTPPAASTPSTPTPNPPANAEPYITGDLVLTAQVGQAYSFVPQFGDNDGDTLTLTIQNKPDWASFNTTTGALTGIPAAGNAGTQSDDILITVSDGETSRSIGPFKITVNSAADAAKPNTAPVIAGTPAKLVMALQMYTFQPSANDADGDKISWSVANLPTWATFNTTTGKMVGQPSRAQAKTWTNIRISASDGKTKTDMAPFDITVQPAPLTIDNAPATSVTVNTAYSFVPAISQLGSLKPTWSIVNKPTWATFNTTTGALTGTPTSVQSTTGIKISAAGGGATGSTATFSITVVSGPNSVPTITGSPATTVKEEQAYSFTPTAKDNDASDTLSFSIANKPDWANFSIATGQLSGTPQVGDAGTYAGIVITVRDGKSEKSLAGFTITVTAAAVPTGSATLSWAVPTVNTDGTPLTTLAGYRIYYGTSATNLSQVIELANPSATSYTVTGLGRATWYFSVHSYNSSNTESDDSNLASKTIN